MTTASLQHPLVVSCREPRTLRYHRPDHRTGVEYSAIAMLAVTALAVWLCVAVELAVGVLQA